MRGDHGGDTRAGTPTSVVVRGYTGPRGSPLERWLADGPQLVGSFAGIVGPLPVLVALVDTTPEARAAAADGLPDGSVTEEALAVRLRRAGVPLGEGPGVLCPDVPTLLALSRGRGRTSIATLRADPQLLCELQAGTWFDAGWRARLFRRVLVRAPLPDALARRVRRPLALRSLADAAFWRGVRDAASACEWQRLTRSSYVVLIYHRLAGDAVPGQEDLYLAPRRFATQMRVLRWLRFRPLDPEAQLRFHHDASATLPPRCYVVTVDDAYEDNLGPLMRHAAHRPQLFAPTTEVGRRARWTDGEPLLDWPALVRMAEAGIAIGSHTRTHASLPDVGPLSLDDELAGSMTDLQRNLPATAPVIAYPHGRHDAAVRMATIAAGYRLAYTTSVGRNGAGTDRWTLRRIGPKQRDSAASFAWKVLTGELLPGWWERRRVSRAGPATQR